MTPPRPHPAAPLQRSFEDLGTPLQDVTFCVVDLETTGTSPAECAITEVGAVKLRGGECLGTFQTLVDPGCGIPPRITVLTGITEAMVRDAPIVDAVLPALLEFIGDAVIVGHNVRFDLAFLRAALERTGRTALGNPSVDTCALARRLVRDEVPNCRLGTLARHLRLDHQPSHRALDDALATGDLLHLLLERAGVLGVTGFDDLRVLPTMAGHPEAGKLALTTHLPRSPGVYLFRGRRGEVLYVGKAANLRARVRSYFSTDERRKIRQLLAETIRIDHRVCTSPLEAAVAEIRLIHRHEPRYNRQGTGHRRYVYMKLSLGERFPRLSVARVLRDDGGLYLGPVRSTAFARRLIDVVESVVPLRRCSGRVPARRDASPCTASQLGTAACPCSGAVTVDDYAAIVEDARRGLTTEPELLLEPLEQRMARLAGEERYEEAAEVRDRAEDLRTTLQRLRRIDQLRRSGTVRVRIAGHGGAEIVDGCLRRTWADDAPVPDQELPVTPTTPAPGRTADPTDRTADPTGRTADPTGRTADPTGRTADPTDRTADPTDRTADPTDRTADPTGPATREQVDELHCVATWFDREAHRMRLLHADGPLSEPIRPLPRFRAGRNAG